MTKEWLLVIGLALSPTACGDEEGDTAGTGGSSGTTLTGDAGGNSGISDSSGAGSASRDSGTGTAGLTGGSGETIVDTQYNKAEHCSPGEYLGGVSFRSDTGLNHALSCSSDNYIAALTAIVYTGNPLRRLPIHSIELAVPMRTGETYALSFEVGVEAPENPQVYQIWGANSECGAGDQVEMLFEQRLQEGKQIVCTEIVPSKAYTYLLTVFRPEADGLNGGYLISYSGAMYCPSGRCP